jgi:hypothetical protein
VGCFERLFEPSRWLSKGFEIEPEGPIKRRLRMQSQVVFGAWVHFAVKLAKLLKGGKVEDKFLIKIQPPAFTKKAVLLIDFDKALNVLVYSKNQ